MDKLAQEEITICTVSFGHKELIEKNIKFVKEMNLNNLVKWVVVENTPEEKEGRMSIGEFDSGVVIKGIPNTFSGVGRESQHHASGLNKAIKEVNTRYALILDPDCYIVRKNWINDVLKHMKDNDLAFFGLPYNPKRYLKYRYFPCIHGMFIDLDRVVKDKIDFNPQYK